MLIKMATYLSRCPELSGRRVCVNYLAEAEGSVSLEISNSQSSVKEYADGGVMRTLSFTLSIRDSFGISQVDNCETARMCQGIERWIEEQNLMGNLPELEKGLCSVSVGVSKCFEIVQTKDFLAKYSAELELIYLSGN